MILVELTSISGIPPYVISICDLTKTFCYVVSTGTPSIPLYVEIPSDLVGSQQLLVVITDSTGCEFFELISCITPTPTVTPSPTPTPTPTPTESIECNCISFTNLSNDNHPFQYTRCDDVIINDIIFSGTTLYVCGSEPVVDSPVTYIVSNPCVDNTCPDPTPTPTPTPTVTPTITPTPSQNPNVKQFQSNEDVDFQDGTPYDFQDF